MDSKPPGSSVHRILWAKVLEWVALLQGIFATQGLNLGLLYCRQILYHLNQQGATLHLRSCNSHSLPQKLKTQRQLPLNICTFIHP